MLIGLGRVSSRDIVFPGSWVFLLVVILLIVLVFIRVYGGGSRSGRTAHRSGRQTVHRTTRVPERGGSHGHRTASRRRPNHRP